MRDYPKLITATDFSIEKVTRKPDLSGEFNVTLKLTDGERRSVVGHYEMLFDFEAFRAAALFAANVLLLHPAQERTPNGRTAWLTLISEAIKRSVTKQQHS